MIDLNPMRAVCNYGSSAAYKDPPTEEQIRCGVVPLDSLPAAWWNWLWNETNSATNEARTALTSVITELNNVLSCAGITPQSACMDQLYGAIMCLRQTTATAATAGAVKSSSVCGQVSVDSTGIMTANGLGNATNLATTTKTTVVAAVNELKSTYDGCFGSVATALTNLENGKLSTNGCAADSALLGGTAKSGLLTDVSLANGQLAITVGGTTCTATLEIPGACFGTATNYLKYECADEGTASTAECTVTLGLARSYNWSACPTDVRSVDRRVYSKIGTCQVSDCNYGMTYIDTCSWKCCYNGSEGVIACTNARWCFDSNGEFTSPGAVVANSGAFGSGLITRANGSCLPGTGVESSSLTFCGNASVFGHITMVSSDGALYKTSPNGMTHCKIITACDTVTCATYASCATQASSAGSATAATRACCSCCSCWSMCQYYTSVSTGLGTSGVVSYGCISSCYSSYCFAYCNKTGTIVFIFPYCSCLYATSLGGVRAVPVNGTFCVPYNSECCKYAGCVGYFRLY